MKAVIQRVTYAKVNVDNKDIAAIDHGIAALIGLEPFDTFENCKKLIDKMIKLRIFSDDKDHMNLSLCDIEGDLLLISQFTLAGSTKRGLRPSFDGAMRPDEASVLFAKLVEYAKEKYPKVQQGQFGADMKVSLLNDGPVTFILEA